MYLFRLPFRVCRLQTAPAIQKFKNLPLSEQSSIQRFEIHTVDSTDAEKEPEKRKKTAAAAVTTNACFGRPAFHLKFAFPLTLLSWRFSERHSGDFLSPLAFCSSEKPLKLGVFRNGYITLNAGSCSAQCTCAGRLIAAVHKLHFLMCASRSPRSSASSPALQNARPNGEIKIYACRAGHHGLASRPRLLRPSRSQRVSASLAVLLWRVTVWPA